MGLSVAKDELYYKKHEVQAAFPFMKSILDGVSSEESKHAIKLTSQGWETK